MASMDFDATGVPTDIVDALGLTSGTRYTGQNVSTTATLFVREAAAMPTMHARAFKVEAGSPFTLKPEGIPLWVWTDDPNGCPLVLDNAAWS